MDQSISSYDGEGVLMKIKEVDENLHESSTSSDKKSSLDSKKPDTLVKLDEIKIQDPENFKPEESTKFISPSQKKLSKLINGSKALLSNQTHSINRNIDNTPPKNIRKESDSYK
jgi:hypothetical protein